MQIGIVSLELLPEIWAKCLPIIEDVHTHNGNFDTAENTYASLSQGKQYLWLAEEEGEIQALAITSIEKHPLKKICSIDVFTSPDLSRFLANTVIIEAWARDNGCDEMLLTCRPGYERRLKYLNYTKTHVVLQKDLTQ